MTTVHFLISLFLGVQWHLCSLLNRREPLRKASQNKAQSGPRTCIDPKDLEVGSTIFAFCKAVLPRSAFVGILRGIHLAHARKLRKLPARVVALQLKEDFLLVRNLFLIGQKYTVSQVPM